MSQVKRYHINEDGKPGACRAKYACPFGDDDAHYPTAAEARRGYEAERSSFPATEHEKYRWPAQAVTRTFPSGRTAGGKVVAQMAGMGMDSSVAGTIQAWLEIPGRGNVAYVQLLVHGKSYHPGVGEHLMMCDIETRPDSRKQGFALELRQALEKETGLAIYSSGNMTPEGWDAFGDHVKTLPEAYGHTKPGVAYRAMGFVASWKDRVPRNTSRDIEYTDEQRDAIWRLSEENVFRKLDDKEILWVEE